MDVLNTAAAVEDLVPIRYEARIMETQLKKSPRLAIICYYKKKLTELYAAPLPKCYRPINQ